MTWLLLSWGWATTAHASPRGIEPRPGRLVPAISGLHLEVGVEAGDFRWFRHTEPSTGERRDYTARVYGGPRVAAGYERAVGSRRWALAVQGEYWHSVALSSWSARLGEPVKTTADRARGQAGTYLRLTRSYNAPTLGLWGGAGRMRFDFKLPTAPDLEQPNGNYTFAQAGLALRVPLGPVTLTSYANYLYVWHVGPLGQRRVWGRTAPQGFETLLEGTWSVLRWLDLTLRASFTQFRERLKSLPQRHDKAARVVDRYLQLGLGVRVRF